MSPHHRTLIGMQVQLSSMSCSFQPGVLDMHVCVCIPPPLCLCTWLVASTQAGRQQVRVGQIIHELSVGVYFFGSELCRLGCPVPVLCSPAIWDNCTVYVVSCEFFVAVNARTKKSCSQVSVLVSAAKPGIRVYCKKNYVT